MFLAAAIVATSMTDFSVRAAEYQTDAVQEEAAEETGEETGEETDDTDATEDASEGEALGKVDRSEWITMEDYEKIAESDTYNMYFYEPRLSIILENKKTGALLESTLSDEKDDGTSNASWNGYMKSGVVLTAIIGTTNTYQVDLMNCEHTMNVTYLDEQDGYMLIPDGNGALIYLDDKEKRYTTGFSQMIYGTDNGFVDASTQSYLWDKYDTVIDANQVIAPVFGMAHKEDQLGYLAIVEEGDKRASIEAHPNGVMVNYNRCFAKFLLRDIFVQPLNQSNSGSVTTVETDRVHSDLKVRYLLLDGEEADYSGMAVAYRDYLLDQELVTEKDTSYNTRVDFLGTEREEFLMGTKAVPMTTTENIEEMYQELQEAGVDSVLTVYKGWQSGGLYDVPITKYKADRDRKSVV